MDIKTTNLFRKWARKYDSHMKETGHYEAMEGLLSHITPHIPQNSPILDPACGTGHLEEYLLLTRPDLKVLANDASQEMIDIAKSKFKGDKRIHFTNYDIHELPARLPSEFPGLANFPKEFFPTVIVPYTMYWIGDEEAKLSVVEMLYSLLTDSGRVISIEEWPLVVTPSPASKGIKSAIENTANPMDPDNINYKIFYHAGFSRINEWWKPIDKKHNMYMRLYFKR